MRKNSLEKPLYTQKEKVYHYNTSAGPLLGTSLMAENILRSHKELKSKRTKRSTLLIISSVLLLVLKSFENTNELQNILLLPLRHIQKLRVDLVDRCALIFRRR